MTPRDFSQFRAYYQPSTELNVINILSVCVVYVDGRVLRPFRFPQIIECSTFLSNVPVGTCDEGQGTLVWNVGETDDAERCVTEIWQEEENSIVLFSMKPSN